MMNKKRVAIIGLGGTISSLGKHSMDIGRYAENKNILDIKALLEKFTSVSKICKIIPVSHKNMPSVAVTSKDWLGLNNKINSVYESKIGLAGIVLTHGTATLEETAFFINLVSKVPIPIVFVGSQRPANVISSDAELNLLNAVRVAADDNSINRGVLGVLNDEIHCARDMVKTSTFRLQTFKSIDFGIIGHADPDKIVYYRKVERITAPHTEFDVSKLKNLPRVAIAYGYAGSDGTAIDAFVSKGAKGIVIAAMLPGYLTPGEMDALNRARKKGVHIVLTTRAFSGRVVDTPSLRPADTILADNLTPQKARVLLMISLTIHQNAIDIQHMFEKY